MQSPRKTRAERHLEKKAGAKILPVSVATINFIHDGNLGFIIRSMACFGASDLHVVGAIPAYRLLTSLSGGLNKYVNITQHKTPSDLVRHVAKNEMCMVSVELDDRSVPLHAMKYASNQPLMLVLGHETTGVPEEILHSSDLIVRIDMPGIGFCLNTSQAGNIVLYELAKQLL